MPALNKQSLINLLIDSPLREAIKINLIDIVNNTVETDLDKTYSTISKELEIYQKATERRLKLASDTIAQLAGTTPMPETTEQVAPPSLSPTSMPPAPPEPLDLPPLPPMPQPPQMPTMPQAPVEVPKAPTTTDALPPLQVPPLDLPPLPTVAPENPISSMPTSQSVPPTMPLPQNTDADEAALQEIQKELDALKNSAATDISTPPSSLPPVQQM